MESRSLIYLPHAIRITEHFVEGLIEGEWSALRIAVFDTQSKEVTWEEDGQRFVRYEKPLPKLVPANGRESWRLLSLNGFIGQVRGVIIADQKRYVSDSFEIKELIQAEQLVHFNFT